MPEQRAGRRRRVRAAGTHGDHALVRRDDVAGSREEERDLLVGHDEQGLELTQRLLGAPVRRELHGRALELAVELLELPLEPCEERHGVGRRAGEARENLSVQEPANLRGAAFHDGRPHRHLAVAVTLFTRFERKLEEFHGQLERAAVELATDWRTEKTLRQLEALLVVADEKTSLLLSGTGDVIAPDEGVLAVGSGGPYASAAAHALLRHSTLDAAAIVKESLSIAASIDIYTNDSIRVETLP